VKTVTVTWMDRTQETYPWVESIAYCTGYTLLCIERVGKTERLKIPDDHVKVILTEED
jgi:hypothetical protein